MTYTARTYNRVAAILKEQHATIDATWQGDTAFDIAARPIAYGTVDALTEEFAVMFTDDNPDFDAERFLKAADYYEKMEKGR
jgi:hypothetical protein